MDLSANTSLAGIAEAVASVLIAASRTGCQVYVAGAMARGLWLEFGHGIETGRRTADCKCVRGAHQGPVLIHSLLRASIPAGT